MNKFLKTVGGVVALTFLAEGMALAATGDAQKWNFGLSAGYVITSKPSVELDGNFINYDAEISKYSAKYTHFPKTLKGATGGINIGYAINDNVRFSLGVGYSQLKFGQTNILLSRNNMKIAMSQKVLTGVATIYYDFSNDSGFTPFVSLGLGIQHVNGKIDAPQYSSYQVDGKTIDSGKDGFTITEFGDKKSKKKSDFRAELGAGLGFKVADGVHLELAYKLANSTQFKYQMNNELVYKNIYLGEKKLNFKISPKLEHSISLGIRFNF